DIRPHSAVYGGQRNTNFDAERALAEASGSVGSAFGPEGHVPTPGDFSNYVAHYHSTYPGDACDRNATTSISIFDTDDPIRNPGSCDELTIVGSTNPNGSGSKVVVGAQSTGTC